MYVCRLENVSALCHMNTAVHIVRQAERPNRLQEARSIACGLQGYASEAVQDSEAAQRKVSETWLVLEYCSKGSLQDALDRFVCTYLSAIPYLRMWGTAHSGC